jgi:predicted nucleic acid-binding protein
MYLLDTNVISELRKKKPHGAVAAWLENTPAQDIYIPAVAIGELQHGVELTRQQDSQKASEIEQWIDRTVLSYSVISMEGADFREWASLDAPHTRRFERGRHDRRHGPRSRNGRRHPKRERLRKFPRSGLQSVFRKIS